LGIDAAKPGLRWVIESRRAVFEVVAGRYAFRSIMADENAKREGK
jgi:hypothetical protein